MSLSEDEIQSKAYPNCANLFIIASDAEVGANNIWYSIDGEAPILLKNRAFISLAELNKSKENRAINLNNYL